MSTNVATDGAFALVRFQPQATAADITAFLETNKLSISGGPSAGDCTACASRRPKLRSQNSTAS